MRVFAGTSGYSYDGWTGAFYPEGLAASERLVFYAKHLDTVEINNTFYRMPRSSVVERWAADVPEGFRFAVKASRRITHRAKLRDVDETLAYLWRGLDHLGDKLGCVLFQLPPYFQKDAGVLRAFLELVPPQRRAVLEFRHASWFDEEVRNLLHDRGAALCVSDARDEGGLDSIEPTAPFGYLRLRGDHYDEAALERVAERIREQPWEQAFVLFKHEAEASAVRWARELARRTADDDAR